MLIAAAYFAKKAVDATTKQLKIQREGTYHQLRAYIVIESVTVGNVIQNMPTWFNNPELEKEVEIGDHYFDVWFTIKNIGSTPATDFTPVTWDHMEGHINHIPFEYEKYSRLVRFTLAKLQNINGPTSQLSVLNPQESYEFKSTIRVNTKPHGRWKKLNSSEDTSVVEKEFYRILLEGEFNFSDIGGFGKANRQCRIAIAKNAIGFPDVGYRGSSDLDVPQARIIHDNVLFAD